MRVRIPDTWVGAVVDFHQDGPASARDAPNSCHSADSDATREWHANRQAQRTRGGFKRCARYSSRLMMWKPKSLSQTPISPTRRRSESWRNSITSCASGETV